jgi:hypothetical protein
VATAPSELVASIYRLVELGDLVIPAAIRAVSDLGIADRLVDGPRSVEDLAEATGAHSAALYRALRTLACKGVFTEVRPGYFALTPLAELLRSDHPLSVKDGLTLLPADIRAWACFDYSLRTGRAAFDYVHGQDYWAYLAEHPEESVKFHRSQQSATRLELRAVLAAYDWGALGTVVDVGGGNGALLAGLLARHKRMRGVLFDLPYVVADATAVLEVAGVSDRCEVIGGSFFDGVPAGGNAYLLKRILYSWLDDHAVTILSNIRRVIADDGRLLILEPLMEPGDEFEPGKIYDLLMLSLGGGGARSRAQLEKVLGQAGFQLTRVAPTLMFPIVEARPA